MCLFRRCPELNACISSTLWCDNVQHCPSGFDESDANCVQFNIPAFYISLGGGILALLTTLILCTSWCKYRQHRKAAREAEKQTAHGTLRHHQQQQHHNHRHHQYQHHNTQHANSVAHNGDIYGKRYSINSADLYLDRKDSLC